MRCRTGDIGREYVTTYGLKPRRFFHTLLMAIPALGHGASRSRIHLGPDSFSFAGSFFVAGFVPSYGDGSTGDAAAHRAEAAPKTKTPVGDRDTAFVLGSLSAPREY